MKTGERGARREELGARRKERGELGDEREWTEERDNIDERRYVKEIFNSRHEVCNTCRRRGESNIFRTLARGARLLACIPRCGVRRRPYDGRCYIDNKHSTDFERKNESARLYEPETLPHLEEAPGFRPAPHACPVRAFTLTVVSCDLD